MSMSMKLIVVAGALALGACGAGTEWDGPGPHGGESPGGLAGGPIAQGGSGGSGLIVGGESPVGGGGLTYGGGTQVGGSYPGGGVGGTIFEGGAGGAEVVGGTSGAAGDSSEGGSGGLTGTPPNLNCLASVSHCFEAAANCFEFSPASNCDEIVDVCAAMQADCDAAAP